jgi:IS30 family transposase
LASAAVLVTGKVIVAFRQEYGKYNLTSLVERRSRFTFLMRNPSRSSAGVVAGI